MTHANIHEFDGTTNHRDVDGDALKGIYFQITDEDGKPIGLLTGPYNSKPEAEAACQTAFDRDDY